jgi:hypothetical protein
MLFFKKPNSKLQKLQKTLSAHHDRKIKVYSFGTLSGHTCKAAVDCLAWVDYDELADSYSLKDGNRALFRCFAASAEAVYDDAYNHRLKTMEFVRSHTSANTLAGAMNDDLPADADYVRIHDAGDIDSATEFKAWILLAKRRPGVVFYGYTKMLPLWLKYRHLIPGNLVLTASRGGKFDAMIDRHNLREAIVVFSKSEARGLGLKLDEDDSSAARQDLRDCSFALLIHGQGKAGSKQAQIMTTTRKAKTDAKREAKVRSVVLARR